MTAYHPMSRRTEITREALEARWTRAKILTVMLNMGDHFSVGPQRHTSLDSIAKAVGKRVALVRAVLRNLENEGLVVREPFTRVFRLKPELERLFFGGS